MVFLVPGDLSAFATIDEAKATAMIEDAEAMAALAAPCIAEEGFSDDATLVAGVKAILRGAVLRWNEAGSGAVTQQAAGAFQQSIDTRQQRRGMFWPSEIAELRDLCERFNDNPEGAFSVDTLGAGGVVHQPWCSVAFGATYCSCGAALSGAYPLYEY